MAARARRGLRGPRTRTRARARTRTGTRAGAGRRGRCSTTWSGARSTSSGARRIRRPASCRIATRRRRSRASPRSASGSPPIRSASSAATSRARRRAIASLATLRFFRDAPQGDAARRRHRLQGLLLPLPRHADRAPLRRRRAVDGRHRAAARRRAVLPRATSTGADPAEAEIRALADGRSTAASTGGGRRRAPPAIAMGWRPEQGFIEHDWLGYNEAMIVYPARAGLADAPGRAGGVGHLDVALRRDLGHRVRPGAPRVPAAVRAPVQPRVGRLPRRSAIATCARAGSTTSRTAAARRYAQRAYAIANPGGWRGYGEHVWGLTACDGPGDLELDDRRRARRAFHGYARARPGGATTTARSRRPRWSSSLPFAPEIVLPGDPRAAPALRRARSTASTASSTRSTRASPTCGATDGRDRGARRRLDRHRLPRHRPGPDRRR